MKIGFNSGALRKCGMSLLDTVKFAKRIGSNAFELSFFTSDSLLKFELTEELIELLSSFDYLSAHAPFNVAENLNYQDDELTRKVVAKLKELIDKLPIEGIVFHPTDVKDFDFLDGLDLPILIENMDARKGSFKDVDDFKKLKEKYDFGFVLDVEHSFENDSSMESTRNLIEVMGDRLKEVHLSGAINKGPGLKEKNHCLLCDSEYREDLLKFLKELKDLPIILEGIAEEGQEQRLKDELNCVRDLE